MTLYSMRDAVRLPGLISLARLPLALAFPWVMKSPAAAIVLLILAAVTDVLDGWTARRRHEVTPTGAALDALMDKIFVLVVAFALVLGGSLTVLEAILLGTRDLGELPLLTRLALQHRLASRRPLGSNVAGKLATVLQFATLVAILLGTPHREIWIFVTSVCGALAATTYWIREGHSEGAWSPR